jgi:hypothetical protein
MNSRLFRLTPRALPVLLSTPNVTFTWESDNT